MPSIYSLTYYSLCASTVKSYGSKTEKRCILTGKLRKALQGGRSMLKVIMCSIVGGMHGGRRREVLFQERWDMMPQHRAPAKPPDGAMFLTVWQHGVLQATLPLLWLIVPLFYLNYLFPDFSLAPRAILFTEGRIHWVISMYNVKFCPYSAAIIILQTSIKQMRKVSS